MADLENNQFFLKKMHRAVEVRDANKDGKITRADFDLVFERYKAFLNVPESDARIEELSNVLYSFCDSLGLIDHDKALTYEEMTKLLIKTAKKQTGPRTGTASLFDKMFLIIDTNRDGSISFKDWVNHYRAMGIPEEYAEASFQAQDGDKDGAISREKFDNYHYEFFFTAEDKLHSSLLYGPLKGQ